jgi:hypothetical protein
MEGIFAVLETLTDSTSSKRVNQSRKNMSSEGDVLNRLERDRIKGKRTLLSRPLLFRVWYWFVLLLDFGSSTSATSLPGVTGLRPHYRDRERPPSLLCSLPTVHTICWKRRFVSHSLLTPRPQSSSSWSPLSSTTFGKFRPIVPCNHNLMVVMSVKESRERLNRRQNWRISSNWYAQSCQGHLDHHNLHRRCPTLLPLLLSLISFSTLLINQMKEMCMKIVWSKLTFLSLSLFTFLQFRVWRDF